MHHELPRMWPSVVLYRFESALVFYNAPYFKKRVLEVAASRPGIKWFVVDGGPINIIDSTGATMLEALAGDLRARGIRLGFANLRTEVRALLERSGVEAALGEGALFPTLKSAVAVANPAASRRHLADHKGQHAWRAITGAFDYALSVTEGESLALSCNISPG